MTRDLKIAERKFTGASRPEARVGLKRYRAPQLVSQKLLVADLFSCSPGTYFCPVFGQCIPDEDPCE